MENYWKYCELKALLLVSPEKRVVGPLRLLSLSFEKQEIMGQANNPMIYYKTFEH